LSTVLVWSAMTNLPTSLLSIASRVIVVGACCLGIWDSWKLARADYLFRQDTEESIRSAMRLEPDAWRYYMRLSQFDDADAEQLMGRALQLNAYDAPADIELGLYAESTGDYVRAEKLMLEAFAIDHTFATRWALANFYFRRGNESEFWAWAQSAAKMPSDGAGALFELCWRESPDADRISSVILNDNPKLIRQYIDFLFTKDQLPAAASAAQRLIRDGNPAADTPQLLSTIDRLVTAGDGTRAVGLWHSLIARQWIDADATQVNNPMFARVPLSVSFDWTLPSYDGLHSWTGPGGLEAEFTGTQPETCIVAEQSVVLSPGKYSLQYAYRTSEISRDTGLKWQIIEAGSDKPLAESSDLSSDGLQNSAVTFSVSPGVSLLRIRLAYQRALGTTRISGRLAISSVQIESGL
jgi:tetratricopeptide (TPR) repeat protein